MEQFNYIWFVFQPTGDGHNADELCGSNSQSGSKGAKLNPTSNSQTLDVELSASSSTASASTSKQEKHWSNLKKYVNVNDHMKGLDQGKYAPKVSLMPWMRHNFKLQRWQKRESYCASHRGKRVKKSCHGQYLGVRRGKATASSKFWFSVQFNVNLVLYLYTMML